LLGLERAWAQVFRFLVLVIAAIFRPRALLIAENLCPGQQLLVPQRRHPRPRLSNADRRFCILASRWLGGWRNSLLIVAGDGSKLAATGLQGLLDVAIFSSGEGRSPGDRGGTSGSHQAHVHGKCSVGPKTHPSRVGKVGFKVSARTVAKYMRARHNRGPSPGWREFLKLHAPDIWACDFFCVRTVLFQTLDVFFVVRYANREILHAEVTRHPTADWAAQQIVECCVWDRAPPRFLIHDRDSRYGASFDRRVQHLGIEQIRTPFRSPRANAVAERWVRSVRSECLDDAFVFSERNLRRALSSYVTYYNRWRPHRSLGQRAPCGAAVSVPRQGSRMIVAKPVLGGLHPIYGFAE
jgi:putative transposase